MINDSVREDLIGKISARLKPINLERKEAIETKENTMSNKPLPTATPKDFSTPVSETPKSATTDIAAKPTSPTLVEFHSKNSIVPEWRLQLQNAVRQRQGQSRTELPVAEQHLIAPRAKLVTSGANALKAEIVEAPKPTTHKNPDLARALERIEKSRQKFLVEEETVIAPTAPKANKNFPFYIAAKTNEADIKPAETNPPIGTFAKPKLAAPPTLEKVKLDTNKLPPLSAQISESFAVPPTVLEKTFETKAKAEVKIVSGEEASEVEESEEYDDCPTFAMRFNAGLFDLIIGSFASICLLAPFMLIGGNWLSGAGFFAFAATSAIVMFVYLTTAIGFYGRTFGMRLFSLELVDIEGEEYPSFHQAAVSSSVYLLSLAFGGLGFLTVFFNDEKRAAHDLVSKTIIVKE